MWICLQEQIMANGGGEYTQPYAKDGDIERKAKIRIKRMSGSQFKWKPNQNGQCPLILGIHEQ